MAQLRELGQLHDSGVLDDAEFELQKSQILNS
ncbi:SHOCT domain-containing protein [Geodermatophilus sp. SYSU D00815]